jgi:thiol-disulfide isomerase/thioredoxin
VGVPPGEAVVTVHMDGYAPQLKLVAALVDDSAPVEIRLSPGATIKGVVKDGDGKPVASAEAVAGKWQGHDTLGLRAMTDERGEFVIENIPLEEFELTVYAEKMTPEKLIVSARDSQTIEIELEAGDDPADRVPLAVGAALPAVALKGLDGKPIDLKSYAGRVLVIDFWATWCGPCLTELPKLTEVYEKYKSREDFALIGISRDFEEADLRNFLMGRPRMTWPQVVGADNGSDEAAEKFGVSGIPALFVIDKKGNVAVTGISAEELPEHIDKLLKAAGPE